MKNEENKLHTFEIGKTSYIITEPNLFAKKIETIGLNCQNVDPSPYAARFICNINTICKNHNDNTVDKNKDQISSHSFTKKVKPLEITKGIEIICIKTANIYFFNGIFKGQPLKRLKKKKKNLQMIGNMEKNE